MAVELAAWVKEREEKLRPPICNILMHKQQLSIMIVGGPNQRTDFHVEEVSTKSPPPSVRPPSLPFPICSLASPAPSRQCVYHRLLPPTYLLASYSAVVEYLA